MFDALFRFAIGHTAIDESLPISVIFLTTIALRLSPLKSVPNTARKVYPS